MILTNFSSGNLGLVLQRLLISIALASTVITSRAAEDIDILICYTDNSEAYYGGKDGMEAHVLATMASANEGLENSRIELRLNLMGIEKIDYVEDPEDMGNDLEAITYQDGVADEIFELRDRYGADLVCLFRDASDPDTSGIAWILESEEGEVDFGFSVVEARASISGYVFLHEIGHNLGAAHDRENAEGGGLYPYSYGYRFEANRNEFRTVMAYWPGWELNYFSNPDVSFNGEPMGISESNENSADNAKTLNKTSPIVASYRNHNSVVAVYGGSKVFLDSYNDGSESILLDGSSSFGEENIVSWIWSWSGGSSIGEKVDVVFPLGETEVELRVEGGSGAISIHKFVISIKAVSKIVDIEGGSFTCFLLDEDGALWASGSNEYGQLGLGHYKRSVSQFTQVLDSGVIQVSAGDAHTLVLKTDGSVWGMGLNEYGELGIEGLDRSSVPVKIIESGGMHVSAGDICSFIVKTDGSLLAFGYNGADKLGLGQVDSASTPQVVIPSGVSKAYAGGTGSLVVKGDGSLWKAGEINWDRSSGFEKIIDSGVVSCSEGEDSYLIVKSDGSLWGYGENNGYQLGKISSDLGLSISDGVTSAVSGENKNYYIGRDQSLWRLGKYSIGFLEEGASGYATLITEVFASRVLDIVSGYYYEIVLKDDGSIWARGRGSSGVFGMDLDGDFESYTKIREPFEKTDNERPEAELLNLTYEDYDNDGVEAVQLDASSSSDDWLVVEWKWLIEEKVYYGETIDTELAVGEHRVELTVVDDEGGLGIEEFMVKVVPPTPVKSIEAGLRNSFLLKESGLLLAAGFNDSGSLGDGTTESRFDLAPVFLSGVKAVSVNGATSLVLMEGGKLYGFGSNDDSQLVPGSDRYFLSPQLILAEGVSQISAGGTLTTFLKEDGTLWALGDNRYGNLTEEGTDIYFPIQIDSNVIKASAGGRHLIYIKHDGSLWGRGNNEQGQLGRGNTSNFSDSVEIVDGGVVDISSNWSHSLFLKDDGSLWGMGSSDEFELGSENRHNIVSRPIELVSSGVVSIEAGNDRSFFIMEDASLWGMGNNDEWALGRHIFNGSLRKIVLNGVEEVSGGITHTLVRLRNGSVFTLGENHFKENRPEEFWLTEVTSNGVKAPVMEDWLKQYFTAEEIVGFGLGHYWEDADADGMSNEIEEELGFDPSDASSRLSYDIYEEGGRVVYEVFPYSPLINYNIEKSYDLHEWSEWDWQESQIDPDSMKLDLSDEGAVFLRSLNEVELQK
ncbi:M12 family metallo-peptidase [Puniceicoccaceae bacterium K14]|nr:M12 family metallo-peptidase [Puniceicoccaceae bacterium K14]